LLFYPFDLACCGFQPVNDAEFLLHHLKRVDIRFWKDDTVPTKEGVSLHLDQWKALCNMSDVIDDLPIVWAAECRPSGLPSARCLLCVRYRASVSRLVSMESMKKGQIYIIQTWKTIEYKRIKGLCLPCSMTELSTWIEF
jgi:hypothetical protein